MKWLLNFFSRGFLIRVSLILQPLLRIYFRGNKFIDPIDGSRYRKFLTYGYGEQLRPNALCPGTLSLERHRMLWLYLERETSLLKDELKVLHIAPEQVFYKIFKGYQHWDYTTADLKSPLADVLADICDLPFEDQSYDLILCNHVLEHIPDDLKAMNELYRILKKGGTLIAQVPIDVNLEKTYEDKNVTDPKVRARLFGQYDHVRVYGQDYYLKLESVGFLPVNVHFEKTLTSEEIDQYALSQEEQITVMIKS